MKRFLIGTSLLAMALLACSSAPESDAPLVWWQFWTNPEVRPTITQLVTSFENASKAKVQLGDLTWSDGHEKIAIALSTGGGPDVIELGSDWVAEFAASKRLLDLTDHLGGLRDSLLMWEPGIYKGRVYAAPWMLGTRVLFCNRTLLAQAGYSADFVPRTWAEMLEAARKVDELGEDIFGFGSNSAERHRLYKKYLPFFWSAGGEVFNANATQTQFNTAAGRASLDFYLLLSESGIVETQARIEEYFAAGKVGFVISGEWLAGKLLRNAPGFEYFAAVMPAAQPGGIGYSFAGGEYLVINESSQNREAALALLHHLTLPENDALFTKATGSFTPVNKFTAFEVDSAAMATASVFQQQIGNSRATPVHPGWVAVEEILERGIEQALYGKMTSQEALEMIDRETAPILQKYAER
ncbi:MAG: extracellular solute-binding protein [Candidatus Zixiibacteriota bacterium]